MDLRGKTLIVTGASRGIGRALASELAQNGVNLVLNARSKALLEEVAHDFRGKGVQALAVIGDAALASARAMPIRNTSDLLRNQFFLETKISHSALGFLGGLIFQSG